MRTISNGKATRNAKAPKAPANVPAVTPVTPAPAAEPVKAAPAKHDAVKLTYAGPSPTVRGHGRKLSAIRSDLGAAAITTRDETFIRDLRAVYADKPFKRLDTDAGCVRRAIAHGFITMRGEAGSWDAELTITKAGLEYGRKA